MTKRMFALTALVVALSVMFCLPTPAQGQQVYRGFAQPGPGPQPGTEEPCILNQCIMYAGDFDPNGPNPNALWNNNSILFGITLSVYVPFDVPKQFKGAKGKTDWNVTGFFTNQLFFTPIAPSVSWAVVQDVVDGGNPDKVTKICSGTGVPTLTPTGRADFGLTEYTILLTGTSCVVNLEAGQYWLTFLPTVEDLSYLSDVEDNTPANAQGPGTEPVDESFIGNPFENTATFCGDIGCDRFSIGVIGTAVK